MTFRDLRSYFGHWSPAKIKFEFGLRLVAKRMRYSPSSPTPNMLSRSEPCTWSWLVSRNTDDDNKHLQNLRSAITWNACWLCEQNERKFEIEQKWLTISPNIGINRVLKHPPSRCLENPITLKSGDTFKLGSQSVLFPSIKWRSLWDVSRVQLHNAVEICIRYAGQEFCLDPFSQLSIRTVEPSITIQLEEIKDLRDVQSRQGKKCPLIVTVSCMSIRSS